MRALRTALIFAFLSGMPMLARAAEAVHDAVGGAAGHEEAPVSLPADAPRLFNIGFFQVTNSMLVTWVVAALLIIGSQTAMRNVRAIPEGAQNFWEWLVEGLYYFLQDIIGADLVQKTFWFFATLFIFILSCNWLGLVPGVGTIGWGHPDANGVLHHISEPLFRGVNADLNMTLAMSMIFFACWTVWAVQANGVGGFLMHLFGPKGDTTGLLKVLMIFVFMMVGVLEVVSIIFRPVSLSFRLYGNIFAGENMLETMARLGGPLFGWLLALPFYFMELLVGVVQALVFMLLTSVFTLLICQHDEEHAHAHGHGHSPEPARH